MLVKVSFIVLVHKEAPCLKILNENESVQVNHLMPQFLYYVGKEKFLHTNKTTPMLLVQWPPSFHHFRYGSRNGRVWLKREQYALHHTYYIPIFLNIYSWAYFGLNFQPCIYL